MWDDFAAWLQSSGGARVLQTAIIPALAILVAGVLAALIARSAVKATIRRADRAEAVATVAGLVAAARATVDAEGDLVSRRRAARLRAEADVRTRLLPLDGAETAADWAAARIDAIEQRTDGDRTEQRLADLRDALVQWVQRPGRAKRIFVTPIPTPSTKPAAAATPAAVPTPEPEPAPVAPVASAAPTEEPQPETEPRDRDRFSRPGSRRSPAEPESEPEGTPDPEPALVGAAAAAPAAEATLSAAASTASPAAASSAAAAAIDGLPAWQRTRAVERLQQERARGRAVEAPTPEDDQAVAVSTTPVQVPRTHRAESQPTAAEAEEAIRLEAHQQARHARPTDEAPAATGAVPAATPAPAWLDNYDDEAQVTQNLDLKTPPPVAATSVRDRGPGEDLVPRS
ncbi:hypothetical protein [Amnibacterium kyonggiense]|uniref:Uncharacterized protein n=1 Tax=Amnibacterium kyonggiense TaxID=595671 RepID=A0A4R7FT76_9MICO|nr:hypothetical protein [Amnibacterium kyonggiense]TDS81091.1 hypothetical protein CLV52_1666 [Amnibacterium kyonggiense]